MGLIIKDKIQQLIVGYPTVSDKYNVAGAVLMGDTPVKFGELVKFKGKQGYVEAITAQIALADIAGFVLATNVKLADGFPGTTVETLPGEALNLVMDGFMAIELDATAQAVDITMVPAVGAASTDTAVVAGKTYYTRTSNSDGAGYLNDGTYKYTKVDAPTGNPSTSNYYEMTEVGVNGATDDIAPNKAVAVFLNTDGKYGKLTTTGVSGSTDLVGVVFTGTKEFRDGRWVAEILVK